MNIPAQDPAAGSFLRPQAAPLLSSVLTVFCCFLAYSNSFSGPFVLDDIPTIVDSVSIRKLWPLWPVLFEGDTSALGRPLLNLTFALNYAISGTDVASYHAVNLILHILAGLTLSGIVRRTLLLQSQSDRLRQHSTAVSLSVTLPWLLHPLQTESVTYITQRAESLVGLFYLLTLYCSIRSLESPRSGFWPVVAFGSCLLGVASKEVMVSAPLAVVLYDLTFSGRNFRRLLRRRRILYAALFATWIPLTFLVAQGRQDSAGFGFGLSPLEYLLHQLWAVTHYLKLCFWPNALVLDYGVGVIRNPEELLPCGILLGLLAAGSLVAIRYQPWLAYLGFLFFASISPSSSVIPIVTQTAAEHRMYLPLAPVLIFTVILLWAISARIARAGSVTKEHIKRDWLILSVMTGFLVLICAGLTFARNAEYADVIRLWSSNVNRWPESLRPYMLIGSEYIEKRQDPETAVMWYDRAVAAFQTAVQRNRHTKHLDLQLAGVHFGRATAYSRLRRFTEALEDFDRTIELNPTIVDAHFYRGMVLGQIGREDEAITAITNALNLEVSPERLFIRGEILARKKRYQEAIADLDLAISMDGTNPYFYQSRGASFLELGQYSEAVASLSEAIGIYPDFQKALLLRGKAYASLNRHVEAIEDFTTVIMLPEPHPDAFLRRAESFESLRDLDSAMNDVRTYEILSRTEAPEISRRIREKMSE